VTRFAVCFLLVFGELAFGGTLALAVPPFFKVERGFYKSSGGVYLGAGLLTAAGLALLAYRGDQPGGPRAATLWMAAALWLVFAVVLGVYLVSLWTDAGRLRARSYTGALAAGLAALIANVLLLMPAGFGAVAGATYALTALVSALMLGLVSGAMMFGHWYLIDPNLPVEYLKSFVRLLRIVLVADLGVLIASIGLLGVAGGAGALAVRTLFDSDSLLLAARLLLGPLATLGLAWMTWKTLEVPQTMAATGLLYIAVMSALVGEMLGRFILFRTSVPL